MENPKLKKLAGAYRGLKFNKENYHIGGGIVESKFASARHEEAGRDKGKSTVGRITQKIKLATGESTADIRAYIFYIFKNLEWHHAGKLPRQYGGGMKKTYFLNSEQIVLLAEGFEQGYSLYKKLLLNNNNF